MSDTTRRDTKRHGPSLPLYPQTPPLYSPTQVEADEEAEKEIEGASLAASLKTPGGYNHMSQSQSPSPAGSLLLDQSIGNLSFMSGE